MQVRWARTSSRHRSISGAGDSARFEGLQIERRISLLLRSFSSLIPKKKPLRYAATGCFTFADSGREDADRLSTERLGRMRSAEAARWPASLSPRRWPRPRRSSHGYFSTSAFEPFCKTNWAVRSQGRIVRVLISGGFGVWPRQYSSMSAVGLKEAMNRLGPANSQITTLMSQAHSKQTSS